MAKSSIADSSSSVTKPLVADSSSNASIAQSTVAESSSSANSISRGNEIADILERKKAEVLKMRIDYKIPSKSVSLSDVNFKLKTHECYPDPAKERMVRDLQRIMIEHNLTADRGKFASTVISPEFLETIRKS
jgi:hypothetical protein